MTGSPRELQAVARAVDPQVLDGVQAITRAAGRLALRLGPQRAERKQDGSWVTQADTVLAERLKADLARLLPEATHLDEESGGAVGSQLAWVVDPIDGTSNFKRGDDRWCVSVALLAAGEPVLGVIHQPTLDRTWAADAVGPRFQPDGPGDVGMLLGGRVPFSIPRWMRMLRYTRGAHSLRLSGSTALDMVDVAAGRAHRAMAMGASLWDYAAGVVLVRAAGGSVERWPVGSRWDVLSHHRPRAGR